LDAGITEGMEMKALALALALSAIASVGHCQTSAARTPWQSMTEADTQLFWREASGPNGEQDTSALPLYRAVFAHDQQAAAKLLAGGASPNAILYPNRWSAVMVATAYQDTGMIDLLSHHGANLNYVSDDPADYTALGVALNAAIAEALTNGQTKADFRTFNHLLDAGADINLEFNDEDIAIFAATLGQMELVNELLARGYHRDLAELDETLHIRQVDDKTEPEKQKAIQTIRRLKKG
jgi:hypothetical protein